jgi:uncharacterized membrane protein YphA (DoxX/SURF4 family)
MATASVYVAPTTQRPRADRTSVVVSWILQIPVAALFAFAGLHKLTGDPAMVQLFDAIGIGQWFRYVTGTLEAAGAIGLVVPAVAPAAAVGLIGVMTGAILSHLFVLHNSPAIPLVLLTALVAIAWLRRATLARWAGAR